MTRPVLFVTDPIDRSAALRRDAAWLAARLAPGSGSRYVPIWRGRALVSETASGLAAVMPDRLALPAEPIALLGLIDGVAYFAVELSGEQPLGALDLGPEPRAQFIELRAAASRLDAREAALLAHAKGLLHWHSRHLFCGICGSPTRSEDAGHVRRCANPACATAHFPRTDPAVIMLVAHGDEILLGRQKIWPPGMYSVLAGFVEPGETLEQAVAREVFEEAGIEIEDVRYRGSQPWPFPASIMLGFCARAKTYRIRVDAAELEDARWVSRRHLIDHPDDPALRVPPSGSIARRLVDDWLDEG
jgi:NAD+ diphosphatase